MIQIIKKIQNLTNIFVKIYLISLVLVGSASYSWCQNNPKTSSLNLEQCVQYALENNQNILNKSLEKDIAKAKVGETLSRGMPQVNINGSINYNYKVQTSLINTSNFNANAPKGQEAEVRFGQPYDGRLSLTAKQLIFDGSFFVGLQAARVYKELSAKDHIQTKVDVAEAVTKAYYNLLITQERLELIDKNYARIDTLLNDTQAMYKNGFVEKIDVSRIKVRHNNITVERNKLSQLAQISNDLLKFQMGMPLADSLIITDSIGKLTFEQVENTNGKFNYSNRIEYSKLQTNELLINYDMKNNRVQYLPTLYANFNYGINTATGKGSKLFDSDRWFGFGTVGLSLSIPVFDGLLKRNKIQRNKIQLLQLDNTKRLTENSIDLQIKQSKINLNSAIENMEAQRQNMELAQEVFDVSRIKYEQGIGANSEVLDADNSLKQAQTNYYNAVFDALVAKVDLQKANGTLYNVE